MQVSERSQARIEAFFRSAADTPRGPEFAAMDSNWAVSGGGGIDGMPTRRQGGLLRGHRTATRHTAAFQVAASNA